MKPIFHIAPRAEVLSATASGNYRPQGFEAEGFIHCCYAPQILFVANAFFAGQSDLVLLEIDPAQVPAKIVDEAVPDSPERFPHLYGDLPMAAVMAIHDFPWDGTGQFTLPEAISSSL